jgi:hypothetical protein
VAAPGDHLVEAALHKIAALGMWPHGIWIVSIIGMVLTLVLGRKPCANKRAAIERALLQASQGALRAGAVVLAIAVTVLATGGVCTYVYPSVVLTPPEFEFRRPLSSTRGSPCFAIRLWLWTATLRASPSSATFCANLSATLPTPKHTAS